MIIFMSDAISQIGALMPFMGIYMRIICARARGCMMPLAVRAVDTPIAAEHDTCLL